MKPFVPYLALAIAVITVSSSAPMIREAQAEGIPSLAIAAWRLAIAAAVLLLVSRLRGIRWPEKVRRREIRWLLISGVFLALHFATWIASLEFTSVATSTALVSTTPVWIALAGWLWMKNPPTRHTVVAIAVALLGTVFLVWADMGTAAATPARGLGGVGAVGAMLALMGSVTVCGYLLIGKRLSSRFSTLTYVTFVYTTAAAVLLALALTAGASMWGYSAKGWLMLALLALGPQLLGHTCYNWSLKHVSPALVAVTILAEPVFAAFFAWVLFGEGLAGWQLVGFVILLAGIFLAARAENASQVRKNG